MTQVIFDFSELITDCLHDKEIKFTNAVSQEIDSKVFRQLYTTLHNMQRIKKCDKCKKDFIQKWINRKKQWSQLNEIYYWTGGKKWNNYKFFCRSCLKNWFELEREAFDKLIVDESKRRTYFSYRGHGAFDKPDYLNK